MLPSESTQQHILVVGDGSLLDAGITHLLSDGTDLRISHATYSGDPFFLNSIVQAQPDMILVSESGAFGVDHILDLFSSHLIVKGLPIVVVRRGESMIDVYENPTFVAGRISCQPKRISVRTGADLLRVVKRQYK